MILCRQISDVIANENARYKRNELESNFSDLLTEENSSHTELVGKLTTEKGSLEKRITELLTDQKEVCTSVYRYLRYFSSIHFKNTNQNKDVHVCWKYICI